MEHKRIEKSTSAPYPGSSGDRCLDRFKFYEPVPVNEYTFQVWQIIQSRTDPTPRRTPTKTKVRFQSYLPPGTHGVKLPNFTTTLRSDPASSSSSASKPSLLKRTHVSSSSPCLAVSKDNNNKSKHGASKIDFMADSPELLISDSSEYVSPFHGHGTSFSSPFLNSHSNHHHHSHNHNFYSTPSGYSNQNTHSYEFRPAGGFRGSPDDRSLWQISIYKNGGSVDPTQMQEFCFLPGVEPDGEPWANRTFSKAELCALIEGMVRVIDTSIDVNASEFLNASEEVGPSSIPLLNNEELSQSSIQLSHAAYNDYDSQYQPRSELLKPHFTPALAVGPEDSDSIQSTQTTNTTTESSHHVAPTNLYKSNSPNFGSEYNHFQTSPWQSNYHNDTHWRGAELAAF